MIGRVIVMEPADYQRWLTTGESGAADRPWKDDSFFAITAAADVMTGSNVVHAPPLEGVYGKQVPLASGEMVTADDQYMRDSILLPGKQISAGYDEYYAELSGHISEAEIMQIIAYLKSITAKQRQSRADRRSSD